MRAEQHEPFDQAAQVHEHVQPIVDEMGERQGACVLGLVRPAPAKSHVIGSEPRSIEEAMLREPLAGAVLDPRSGLGHQPHPGGQRAHVERDGGKRAGQRGRAQGRSLVAVQKARVVTEAADDDAADVDAEPRAVEVFMLHARSMRLQIFIWNSYVSKRYRF